MDILSIIPVEFKAMSIITLLLYVAMIFIFYLIYIQMRKDRIECKEQNIAKIKVVENEHNVLKNDFEDTRKNLYDKVNEVKDDFGDVKITVARTEQMIKSNADIQKIIQKDISEIRERMNHKK